ncbi:nuclear transport factor 2 family protein [Sporomusa aerivorans]|uniref:nuclear transport factor 2 family protein n=1 Tax=Sporomusa aerivorans TaxID=204936 RepID=UPI00352A8EF5
METCIFLEHGEKDTQIVKQVKNLYQALKANDKEAIAKILADDPVWDVSPGFPYGGVYTGMAEIFGSFYSKLRSQFSGFGATPETFIDGGDVVTVLGFYNFDSNQDNSTKFVRFSHTWKINDDGRIKGVWQVADTAQFIF